MKALITGANSLIGAGLADRLLQQGHAVTAFDVDRTRVPSGCEFVSGDVRDFAALEAAANGCDAGIHLAAVAGEVPSAEILSVNVLGAIGFLEASRSSGFRCAVIASSAPVHLQPGAADNGILLQTADNSDHAYDLSKLLQEIAARDFHRHGLPCLCLRFGHVVHGHLDRTFEGVSLADEDYCRGGWVAIEDVVKACAAALTVTPRPDDFEVLNLVGSRSGRSRFDVARTENRLSVRLAFDFAEYGSRPTS